MLAFFRSGARCGESGLKGTLSERRRSSSSGLLSLEVIDFPAHESNFLEEATVARFSSAYYHVKSINSRSLTLLRSRTDNSSTATTFRERKNSPLGKFPAENVACRRCYYSGKILHRTVQVYNDRRVEETRASSLARKENFTCKIVINVIAAREISREKSSLARRI